MSIKKIFALTFKTYLINKQTTAFMQGRQNRGGGGRGWGS